MGNASGAGRGRNPAAEVEAALVAALSTAPGDSSAGDAEGGGSLALSTSSEDGVPQFQPAGGGGGGAAAAAGGGSSVGPAVAGEGRIVLNMGAPEDVEEPGGAAAAAAGGQQPSTAAFPANSLRISSGDRRAKNGGSKGGEASPAAAGAPGDNAVGGAS